MSRPIDALKKVTAEWLVLAYLEEECATAPTSAVRIAGRCVERAGSRRRRVYRLTPERQLRLDQQRRVWVFYGRAARRKT
jgi:hypothetical protein